MYFLDEVDFRESVRMFGTCLLSSLVPPGTKPGLSLDPPTNQTLSRQGGGKVLQTGEVSIDVASTVDKYQLIYFIGE